VSGKKQYHIPTGHPCRCGKSAFTHRVSHTFKSDKKDRCTRCGLPEQNHRPRHKARAITQRRQDRFIGIDGEGQGKKDHRYVLLSASDESGQNEWCVMAKPGERLTTVQCLDFILSLPKHTRLFSYFFNYDLTKILTDLTNEALYLLFRPELRQRAKDLQKHGPWPVKWQGYYLNLQGTKFSVGRGPKRVVIWDIGKFYQSKFVTTIKDWKVGDETAWERISTMKDKRDEFDKESMSAVKAYNLEECRYIAALARKLVEAHEKAGLKLKTFYGAGSSGAAMLNKMGIRAQIKPAPPEMKEAIASGFFGGRFENSVIGSIPERVWNYDISSAYPYQTTFLPCLLHGTWVRRTKRSDLDRKDIKAALVRYTLGDYSNPRITRELQEKLKSWGPFPFRTTDGTISFPIQSGGGWVWRDEYLEGEALFPYVEFREAWVYHCECDCQPFSEIPGYYIFRIQIGKEGPGIIVKLAVNSCYGKLAQSVGNALFNSWIWAGIITSGCRAQALQLLGLHTEWRNLLMIATDGVYTRERFTAQCPDKKADLPIGIPAIPNPRDTGTFGTGKPLGGWEEKECKRGIFIARPGVYFPLQPSLEELKDVRGRGLGRSVILNSWQKIVDTWEKDGINGVAQVANVSRFCGAKTSVHMSRRKNGKPEYSRANAKNGIKPAYGQWVKRSVDMTFNPLPKRETVNPDGLTLKLREFPKDLVSVPYDRATMMSDDALMLKAFEAEMIEQPDLDLNEYL